MNGEGVSPETRQRLLELARRAIAAHLEGAPPPTPAGGEALPTRGVFVSLKSRATGHLRGCLGHTEAERPLGEMVRDLAIAAATEDPRFPAVSTDELGTLRLEISVLSPLAPIRPEEVEVGRHGLMVQFQDRRGLLLPQVAPAQGWDRETFLDYTCRKAGVPAGSWRDPACILLAFTATVFAED